MTFATQYAPDNPSHFNLDQLCENAKARLAAQLDVAEVEAIAALAIQSSNPMKWIFDYGLRKTARQIARQIFTELPPEIHKS